MTQLSSALNSSLSGLASASRITQTISNNVSNALTDGYAAREVIPTARSINGVGSGVVLGEIQRRVDPVLLAERRVADGQLALASARVDFFSDMESAIGLPDSSGSLSSRVANFGASIIEATTRPESDAQLQTVLNAAKSVANKLNSVSESVQMQRMEADAEIGRAVTFINETLEQIAELNVPTRGSPSRQEAALDRADQRQSLIDSLSEYIPVREMQRENGTVMLFTPGGAILLDGRPATLSFSPTGVITPEMTVSGALSGLSINGQPVSTDADTGKIAGGKLAALFDVRDVQAVGVQASLDAVARDLVERFQKPSLDPTLNPGDAGLITDGGAPFDASNEIGLAQRVTINALVDPSQGGELWRLRDGIGAAAPASPGNSSLLSAYATALNALEAPASGSFGATYTAAGLAGEMTAQVSTSQSSFESAQTFAQSRAETLISAQRQNGVDTDQEMQRLLLVEQAYAANARVISTIDDLIELLTRI
ncbi:MAG: flagellar hook-associated protein FlgK [Pseudomonadota bacterium]